MDFKDNKSIYKQIVDFCFSQVSRNMWLAEERIPSTKDLSAQLGVNPRTVMKAYDELAENGIIFQRRGLGYFISPHAGEIIGQIQRKEFEESTLPAFVKRASELGYTAESLEQLLKIYL